MAIGEGSAPMLLGGQAMAARPPEKPKKPLSERVGGPVVGFPATVVGKNASAFRKPKKRAF